MIVQLQLELPISVEASASTESSALLVELQPETNRNTVTPQPFHIKDYSLNSLIYTTGVNTPQTHINIINYRVNIDRGTFLAQRPSKINLDWVTKSATSNEFLGSHIQKLNDFINKGKDTSRRSPKLTNRMDCVVANLISAYGTDSQLIYSRDTKCYEGRATKNIADYLEQEGLIINFIGKANQYQGNCSYMIPTSKFNLEVKAARVRVMLSKSSTMLEVRAKKTSKARAKPLSISRIKLKSKAEYDKCFKGVQAYNKVWLEHEATIGDMHLVPFCTRIFNQSLDLGGRFYKASHLTLPKTDRMSILIDGCATTEPDFKSLHYCLLYALQKIELNPMLDDPYTIANYERSTAKLASLVLLNSECSGAFKANVTKSGNPANKAIMANYRTNYDLWLKRTRQGLEYEQPIKPNLSKGFIDGMPDNIKGCDLYNSIIERHSRIAEWFGTKNIGGILQKLDSTIMSDALHKLAEKGIAGLPVHDSIRCKVEDEKVVVDTMKQAYFDVIGYNCIVTK